MNSIKEHSGKVILVTGPSGNLGSAVVEKFYQEGSTLILLDRHPTRIWERYPVLKETGSHLLLPGIDLLDPDHLLTAVNNARKTIGRIDCLVHTAGGFQMGEPVHEIKPENWERMMDINVKTLLNISRAVIPIMLEQKNGMIITIGAKPSLEGKKKMGSYSAAKAAVLRLTESIASEGKSSGITARCIIPGTIDTPTNRQAMPDADWTGWVKPWYMADIIYKICFNDYPNGGEIIVPL